LSPFLLRPTTNIELKKSVNSNQVKTTLHKAFDIEDSSDCQRAGENDPNNYEVDQGLVRNIFKNFDSDYEDETDKDRPNVI
jgi:hypothetical protein